MSSKTMFSHRHVGTETPKNWSFTAKGVDRTSKLCRQYRLRAAVSAPPASEALTNGSKVQDKKRIAVLGASGYTGEEVVRLLAVHPQFAVTTLTGESNAGKEFSEVFPHLQTAPKVPKLVKIKDVNWDEVDAAFCCLPHATTQGTLAGLPKTLKIVDLSADFRLQDVNTYAEW